MESVVQEPAELEKRREILSKVVDEFSKKYNELSHSSPNHMVQTISQVVSDTQAMPDSDNQENYRNFDNRMAESKYPLPVSSDSQPQDMINY